MAQNLEQKYTEADYFFQTIEMASDEQPARYTQSELDYLSWKVVKRRQKPQRRYTVSHGAPPAPPSTPTSLTKEHEPLLSPTSLADSNSGGGNNTAVADADSDSERFHLLYTLDYAPKFKKKLKEQERTAAELAELFKVVTITGGTVGHEPITKTAPEHGVSFASRRIRRELNVGSFKVHRNPIEQQTRELYDEDSLSAPEFTRSDDVELPRRRRIHTSKYSKCRSTKTRRKLLVKHFELMEHMDEIADSFDAAMSFRPAQ